MELKPLIPTAEVCMFLYELLKQRPPEANISHRNMPSYDDHCRFVHNYPYSAWYMLTHNAELIGSVYLTTSDEIGVALIPSAQGKGYAKEAIEVLMAKHPRKRYLANVAPGNEASHKLFGKMGKVIQHTYALESVSWR